MPVERKLTAPQKSCACEDGRDRETCQRGCRHHCLPPVLVVPCGTSSISDRSPSAIFLKEGSALNAKASAATSVFQSLIRSVYCGASPTPLLGITYLRGIGLAPDSIQICQSVSTLRNAR